ncbi:MAG TPA: magnesium/cobalt transporter CorA [Gammaproteobacteria bacterium]
MLNVYIFENGRPVAVETPQTPTCLTGATWFDLLDPTEDERAVVTACYRQELPDTEDVEEIEASSRSYEDEAGLHIHSLFLHDVEGRARNTNVAFTLSGERLFTLREREIPAFRLLRMRARHDRTIASDPVCTILSLFEIKIDDLADTIEEIYTGLEEVSAMVLEISEVDMEDALDALAHHEDTSGKVRLCLMDTQRALSFLIRRGRLNPEQAERARELLRDIDSLLPHNSFVFDKINFLMDAAQGFINIEQNKIIKIFSIAAVVFLPPTMIASIYGMNFDLIPELHWKLGYPWALGLMLLAGIAPYWYFKRRGWL